MSLYVTSTNRGAVKKLLCAAGWPSAEVRMWSLAELGEKLREAVDTGRVTMEQALAACGNGNANGNANGGRGNGTSAAVGNDVANNLAAAISAAVAAALSNVKGPDEERIRELVAEAVEEARIRPAVIEIRTGDNVRKVEGRTHCKFDTVLKIVSSRVAGRRLHVWLVGPSGSGKSHLAKQVADALGLPYYCTGAIQSKYDLIGFMSPTGTEATLKTPFRMAFEHGGVFAWDDIDASDPRAFVAFNEALSNGRFAFPDRVVEAHTDFVAIASANTWGNGATADYVGRNKIDAATLSRFVRVEIDYDEELERDLVGAEHAEWCGFVQKIRRAVKKCGVKVLVTPRATLQGAALLAAGIDRHEVEKMVLFAGMDAETEAKVRAAA